LSFDFQPTLLTPSRTLYKHKNMVSAIAHITKTTTILHYTVRY